MQSLFLFPYGSPQILHSLCTVMWMVDVFFVSFNPVIVKSTMFHFLKLNKLRLYYS